MTQVPDLLLRNGRVHTMVAGSAPASALAISGEHIVAVGSSDELDRYAGNGTRVVDLEGATVLPGFTETHAHMLWYGLDRNRVPLDRCEDLAALLDVVSAEARRLEPGAWIIPGPRWHERDLKEGRLPTRAELDRAAPDHRVYLRRGYEPEVAVLNSAALSSVGLSDDSPNPPNIELGRTADGKLDGSLMGSGTLELVDTQLPASDEAERERALERGCKEYIAEGITAVRDPWLGRGELELYARMNADKRLPLRKTGLFYVDADVDLQELGETIEWAYTEFATDDLLHFGGVKLVLDGGIVTGGLLEPYEGRPDFYGDMKWPDDALYSLLEYAAIHRLPLGIHANADASLEQILRVCERLVPRYHLARLRWCLEHVFLASEEQLSRIARLGLLVSYHVPMLHELAPVAVTYWGEERAQRAWPVRSLLGAGVVGAPGSDNAVAPFRPLSAMHWAITRETSLGRPLGLSEAIDRWTAVHGYTTVGPYVMFDESRRGTLTPGRLADLAILDGDPLEPDRNIAELNVRATYVGGQVRYRSDS